LSPLWVARRRYQAAAGALLPAAMQPTVPAPPPRPPSRRKRGRSVRSRAVIVARIKPGAKPAVAALFAESDAGPLPRLAGVRHRSLFALGDVYVHVVETDGDAGGSIDGVRDH